MRLGRTARRATLSLACLALILPLGCEAQALTPLRVGINPWPGYEFVYLAKERGIYDELGLDVRVIEFDSLGDVRRAFERGQIDVMGCTLIELLTARRESDLDPTVIYVPDHSFGGDVILARPPAETVADLRGRRVGLELGSLNTFVLARALEKQGMALDDVELVPRPQLELPGLFAEGAIDAVVTYPPFLFQIEDQGESRRVFTTREIPGEVIDCLAATADATRHRADELVLLVRGFHRARVATLEDPEACLAVMAERERISTDALRQVLEEEIRLVELDEQESYLQRGGKVDRTIRAVDRVLHTIEQVTGPSRVDAATAPHIAERALEAELSGRD